MNATATWIALLFVPANRPDRFARAAASGADAVILDLEDAVPDDAKEAARAGLCGIALDRPFLVRINGAETAWYENDLASLAHIAPAAVILPKAERTEDVARLSMIAPVIALIETARGLVQARAIAQSGYVARLAFGSVDFAADLGCDHVPEALAHARAELVMASRLGGLPPPIDGVTTDLGSSDAVRVDAERACMLGFGGKLTIHPDQVPIVRAAFQPSAETVAWARMVLESGDGAVRVAGMMVDEPVRARARAILSRKQ
jgi:citrate lyase subunit beta/citryl-CoA lyase